MRLPGSLLAVSLSAAVLASCGGGGDALDEPSGAPVLGGGTAGQRPDPAAQVGAELGLATKNTTRLPSEDAVQLAAAVARSVFPAQSAEARPDAVALVAEGDWRAGVSAAQLAALPLRAPLLYVPREGAPTGITQETLEALKPRGASKVAGAKALRVGKVPKPAGLTSTQLPGEDAAAVAASVDALAATVAGKRTRNVLIAPLDDPETAAFAAGYAAKSGEPVLWASEKALPEATRDAIAKRKDAKIYVLGPESGVGKDVVAQLKKLGDVQRIAAKGDPVERAIEFSRFKDGDFGWGVQQPGHGFEFFAARGEQLALRTAAGAPLSGSGSYAPQLLLGENGALPKEVQDHLLDLVPGYDEDPVLGVYNHGWLMGDVEEIPLPVQSRIDSVLEIQPVDTKSRGDES